MRQGEPRAGMLKGRRGRIFIPFLLLLAGAMLFLLSPGELFPAGGNYPGSPHADTTYGVYRDSTLPRGNCSQCHVQHAATPYDYGLFAANDNSLCYTCHASTPTGGSAGYPAQEADRMPATATYPGYFEYNVGGTKEPGVNNRVRWPGQAVFENTGSYSAGKYYSPHYMDTDMTYKDASGYGLCKNCHSPHGTANAFDMLTSTYLNVDGALDATYPDNYQLCFDCHSSSGPVGMNPESRRIADYYDQSINADEQSGHQFRGSSKSIVGSLPSYIQVGDKMPCFNCHNPHGSRGNDTINPNGRLISDQRPGWSGLTDTINDATQVRNFCFGCHVPSDGTAGSITVMGVSMNTIPSSVGAHASTSSTSCYSCHESDYSSSTSRNVHHPSPGGDCITCHSSSQGSREIVAGASGDFVKLSHHVTDGTTTEVVTIFDCAVCHAEGNADGTTNPTYHGGDGGYTVVNLKDADTGGAINTTAEPTLTEITTFCLSCHDSNGAQATYYGANPSIPFSDGRTVLDVKTQFTPTYYSAHQISALPKKYATAGSSGIRSGAFVSGWADNSYTECAHCHMPKSSASRLNNAHGSSANKWLLNDSAGNDTAMTTSTEVCFMCHDYTTYSSGTTDTVFEAHKREGDHRDPAFNTYGIGCLNCHAGGNNRAGSIHGTNNQTTDDEGAGTFNEMRFLNGAALDYWVNPNTGERNSGGCSTQNTASGNNVDCTQHAFKQWTPQYVR